MASNPLVCAVMLTKDRHTLARRALRCFETQTVAHRLLILDSGTKVFYPDHCREVISRVTHTTYNGTPVSVGQLRNIANARAVQQYNPDILMHWDDDDFSAPERLAQQVALLQSSGKDAVGYREMLFWRRAMGGNRMIGETDCTIHQPGEAWLYSHVRQDYCLGTSLMYWRRVWRAKPFEDRNTGEDREWIRGLNTLGVGSFQELRKYWDDEKQAAVEFKLPWISPMMVAEIHGGNISSRVQPESDNWKRVPQWDQRLSEIMRLP